jgi:hypothetical protein
MKPFSEEQMQRIEEIRNIQRRPRKILSFDEASVIAMNRIIERMKQR